MSPAKHHHTSSSMLHGGNYTCRDHPFTYSASHKDTAVVTKNLKLGQISTGLMSIVLFLVQASLFFFSSGFGNLTMKTWFTQSPLNSLCWDVSVTWTLWSIYLGCNFWLIYSVYHPYLVTTQLIGSNALRRKEITQMYFWQGTPVNWNSFQVTTSWSYRISPSL